jgi:hypothetical protein
MNREDIIRMAREAGFGNYTFEALSMFEAFATLVASAEREACAKVCDEFLPLGNKCAYAIRARGQA